MNAHPIILAHGGAGVPDSESEGPERACRLAAKLLDDGETDGALRAVLEAAVLLEDDPRFNAGTGANMRLDGSVQMDAILATSDGRIGSVAAIEKVKNPIRVARLLIDGPHVMLCGAGATAFARSRGVPEHDPTTERAIERRREALRRLADGGLRPNEEKWRGRDMHGNMHGTIGAVGRAADGSFAVASSTGGASMMLPGRVGDTPIFGAGVMCGSHGAVAATGDGEEIIRRLAAMRVYLRMADGEDPQAACEAEVAAFPAPWVVGFIAVGAGSHGMAATRLRMARAVLELK